MAGTDSSAYFPGGVDPSTSGQAPLIIGPQTDGTYVAPDVSVPVTPNDAAGGPPAPYSSQILDLFKYGVGAWSANQQQKQMIDYAKWDATNGGLFRNGQPATIPNAPNAGNTQSLVLFGGLILAVILLTHKG